MMPIRKLLFGFVLVGALTALMVNFAAAATQTLTGVVTDDMCGRKHTMMPGKPDADCVRACVKAGSKYTLLVGDKVYVLKGAVKQVDALAGKRASVTGEITASNIAVTSISAAK